MVTTLELPLTRADKMFHRFGGAEKFMFPANSTSWGGPLQGIVYAVHKDYESDLDEQLVLNWPALGSGADYLS